VLSFFAAQELTQEATGTAGSTASQIAGTIELQAHELAVSRAQDAVKQEIRYVLEQ